jgi:hypothetical protein
MTVGTSTTAEATSLRAATKTARPGATVVEHQHAASGGGLGTGLPTTQCRQCGSGRRAANSWSSDKAALGAGWATAEPGCSSGAPGPDPSNFA